MPFDQLNLVAFGRIDEGKDPGFTLGRPIGKRVTLGLGMLGEGLQVVDFEGKVRQIVAHLDGSATVILAYLDEFLAFGRLEKDQFGPAGALMTLHLLEAEDVLVERQGSIEIGDAVAGVKKFADHRVWRDHVPRSLFEASPTCRIRRERGERENDLISVLMIYLGIDSGTQSTKTIALDLESGAILAQAQEGYGLIEGLPDGHLEQDPQTWVQATEQTVASVLEQLGDRKQDVRGIGVSGQQHGLVVLDDADQPVRAAKLWCDTSTAPQCEAMAAHFGGQEAIIAKAGNAMLPGYTAPKILWLKENEPDHFAATRSILLPHDYLNFWLTGVKRMEYGDASGTALLDVRERVWHQEIMEHIDPRLPDLLPPLGSSAEAHGTLKSELAQRWGLTDEVIVSAGGGDNMMGAIGTGNVRPGVITASLGTSGTLYGSAGSPVVDEQGEIAAFCDSTDQWMPLVCTMNVTVLTEKTRGLFAWELPELESQVATVDAGADGLLFLPYLHGERTPNLPQGKAVLYGLNEGNMTPAHLARAAMEGVTLGLGYGMKRFGDLGVEPTEVRLTGGGSQSATWRQIVANAFGAASVCLQTAEGAGLGAALQAAACHQGGGRFDRQSLAELTDRLVVVDEASRCEPAADAAAAYREQGERQMRLTRELHEGGWL